MHFANMGKKPVVAGVENGPNTIYKVSSVFEVRDRGANDIRRRRIGQSCCHDHSG